MKKAFIILILFISQTSLAQVIDEREFMYKGITLPYAHYSPEGEVGRVIIGFHDSRNSEWTPISWAQELTWLAEELNGVVVVPDEPNKPITKPFVEAFIRSLLSDSLAMDQVSLFTLGNGIDRCHWWLNLGISGVIVSPIWQSNLGGLETTSAYSILSAVEGDSALVLADSLSVYDQWTNLKLVIAEDDYYIDNYKDTYLQLQRWNDSVGAIINDSNRIERLNTALLSPVPEVMRQGQKLELDLFVAKNGPFTISLLDLSAKVVYEIDEYLGKGQHKYVIPTKDLEWGVYKLELDGPGIIRKYKIMIRG